MLTVKHVDRSGFETVYLAETVHFQPFRNSLGTARPPDSDSPEGVTVNCRDGTKFQYGYDLTGDPGASKVYVMNEHGKTVATYNL